MIVHPSSPWYPLVVAAALAPSGPQRVVNVPYRHWLWWRYHLLVPPQDTEDMLAQVHGALAEQPQ